MASFEFLAIIFTGLGLTASILYYSSILRNANKTRDLQLKAQELAIETRQAQLYSQLNSWIASTESLNEYIELLNWEWTDYDDFERKYGSDNNPLAWSKRNRIWGIFDSVGTYVKEGLLDIKLAYQISFLAIFQWFK